MNIQAEKIEAIRLITELESDKVIKKILKILSTPAESVLSDKVVPATPMTKRLKESRTQIAEDKGTKVSLDEIWK